MTERGIVVYVSNLAYEATGDSVAEAFEKEGYETVSVDSLY